MKIVWPEGEQTMKRFKGTVKNNVIVLENGAHLPDGTTVEVRVKNDPEREAKLLEKRRAAFQRILDHQIPGPIGMAERHRTEFCTADVRLYNALHAQLPFVRWIAHYQRRRS